MFIHPMQFELEQARHAHYEQFAAQHRRAAELDWDVAAPPSSWRLVSRLVRGFRARLTPPSGPMAVERGLAELPTRIG